jgi:hypothetical protein
MWHAGRHHKPQSADERYVTDVSADGRCRIHGGASTGPRTPEGVERIRAARTIHGGRSGEAREVRRAMAMLRRAARQVIAALG